MEGRRIGGARGVEESVCDRLRFEISKFLMLCSLSRARATGALIATLVSPQLANGIDRAAKVERLPNKIENLFPVLAVVYFSPKPTSFFSSSVTLSIMSVRQSQQQQHSLFVVAGEEVVEQATLFEKKHFIKFTFCLGLESFGLKDQQKNRSL